MDYDLGINPISVKSGTYPVIIYQLIKQHSSPEDKLTMKNIEDILDGFWNGDKDLSTYRKNLRRTIKRNLATLILLDTNICIERSDGSVIDPETDDLPDDDEMERFLGEIKHVWYRQSLSSTDLQFLTDAVVNSRHLTNAKRREILGKLFNATGTSYAAKTAWYKTVLADADERSVPVSTNLYSNLEEINKAIKNEQCISFNYCYTGLRNEKYTVRKYDKVSPYKIVHENGTYYLIASFPEKLKNGSITNEILVAEIHKLDCINSNIKAKFVPIKETDAAEMTVRDILIQTFHPTRNGHFFFFFDRPAGKGIAELKVNAEGLDILIDKFGNRVTRIQLIYETDPDADETIPKLRNMYTLTLTNMLFDEWDELALLKYKYPRQIRILEPDVFMDGIRHNLNMFKEMYPDGKEETQ